MTLTLGPESSFHRTELVASVRARDKFVNILVNNASVGGVSNDFYKETNVEDISKVLFASDLQGWNEVLHLNTSSMFFTSGKSLCTAGCSEHLRDSYTP